MKIEPEKMLQAPEKLRLPVQLVAMLLWLAVYVMIYTGTANGQTIKEFRQAAEQIDSIRGEFIQEKHMPILARPLKARGYFAYQCPASLRWEYRQPLRSVLLLHDGDVHRYIHSEGRWVEDAADGLQSMDFVLQEITGWLNGRFDNNPLFKVALTEESKIVLTPKDENMARFINRIELTMAKQAGLLQTVTIYEKADIYTRFSFVDPLLNQTLSEDEFKRVP